MGRPKTEDRSRRHCEECRVNLGFRKNLKHDVAIPLEVRSGKYEVEVGSTKWEVDEVGSGK